MSGSDLLKELLSRRDADQAARSAVGREGPEAFARVMQLDEDNATWLAKIVETVGWPGRSLIGEEGAHALWLLAQHADQRPSLQRRCLKLLEEAVAAGEASPTDLAYLTDRVLLASGEQQIYGTQMSAHAGRFIACRVNHPETVNDRRASVGLGTIEAQLRDALDLHGSPSPAPLLCPRCGGEIEAWLPELGGRLTVECPSCRSIFTIRPKISGTSSS